MTDIELEGDDGLYLSLDKYAGGGVRIRLAAYDDLGEECFGAGIHIPEDARDDVAEYLRTD